MSDDLSKVDWKEGFWEQRRIDFAKSAKNSDAIAKRMEALVRRIAKPGSVDTSAPGYVSCGDEARAIVALLPEPVDADLVEARRIVEETGAGGIPYSEGKDDWRPVIKIALAAIRRGRALERDSREG